MGYWGNTTSTIDFCERNYDTTQYIAEFWNTLSSFIFCVIGLIDIIMVYRLKDRSIAKYLIGVCIIWVGLGSALFHATMQYQYQMLDEIPMLWTALAANCCYTVLMFRKYAKLLVFIFVSVNIVSNVLHIVGGYVVLFQLWFSFGVFYMNFSMIYMQYLFGNSLSRKMLLLEFYLFSIAAIVWLFDEHFCAQLYETLNPQLHSWWHILSAFAVHYNLMFYTVIHNIVEKNKEKLVLKKNYWLEEDITHIE